MKITVVNNLTLDGVMQAPGRPDEDDRDGFRHGGWAVPYSDPVMGEYMGRGMAQGAPLLFGRRTYEDFYGFWPHQTDNPFTEVLEKVQKYVASRTLREPLPWANSTLLRGEAADAVQGLEADGVESLTVLGSGALVRSLLQRGMIDDLVLPIHPLVLGEGRRLFPDDATFAALELVEALPTTTGVVITHYRVTGRA